MTAGQEVELYESQPPATLFGTDDPGEVVARATAAARPLAEVVNKQKLFVTIQGRKHVLVEGWCLLGSMLGVFPVTVWTRRLYNDDEGCTGWEARVEARTKHGDVVGAAEAMCLYSEKTWKGRDEYMLRSMAQTRATSKALRQPLGFVMSLGGFSATPAEEMPREMPRTPSPGADMDDPDLIVDPHGNVFPDQREGEPTQFAPPVTDRQDSDNPNRGTVTEAQLRMIRRLVKKLEGMGQAEDVLRDSLELQYGHRHFSQLEKGDASKVITALKGMCGEDET